MTKIKLYTFSFFLLFSASALGAPNGKLLSKKISISLTNVSLEQILTGISEEGKFYFSYNSANINSDSILSVNYNAKSVKLILAEILGKEITPIESGSYIILKKKREKKKEVVEQKQPVNKKKADYLITGKIYNKETGERIENASIYQIGRTNSALSNTSGNYKLQVSAELKEVGFAFSAKNYKDTIIIIQPANTSLAVGLLPEPPKIPYQDIDSRKTTVKSSRTEFNELTLVKFAVPAQKLILQENLQFVEKKFAQISLIPTIGTNRFMSGNVENNISLNILGGYSHSIKGFEYGSLLNIVRQDVTGVQFSGFTNITGGKTKGLQFAGFLNNNRGSVKGLQLAGFANVVLDTVVGAQMAGFTSITHGRVYGAQLSCFSNIATKNAEGLQMAGFSNIAFKDVLLGQFSGFVNYGRNIGGIQSAGFANVARDVYLVQFAGVMNLAYGKVTGAQVATVLNVAKEVGGVQLGLVNLSDTVSGISFGLLNIVLKGLHNLEVSHDELSYSNLAFKTGTRKFYNVFNAGFQFKDKEKLTFGYGFGTEVNFGKRKYIAFELTSNTFLDPETSVDNLKGLFKLNIDFGRKFFKSSSISLGPSFNYFISNEKNEIGEFYSPIPPNAALQESFDVYQASVWLGGRVGIRF